MAFLNIFPTSYSNVNDENRVVNPQNAYSINGSYANLNTTNSSNNAYVRYSGFSGSLPAGSTIVGIKMCATYNGGFTYQSGYASSIYHTASAMTLYCNNSSNDTTVKSNSLGTNFSTVVTAASIDATLFNPFTTNWNIDAIYFEVEYTQTAPTTPSSISYPSSINGGSTVSLTCGASSDPDGNLSGYSWEVNYDSSGTWTVLGTSATTSYSHTASTNKNSAQYRVRAYDTSGLYSSYRTGSTTMTIINNVAPAISGLDSSLGTKSAAFTQTYTVTDADGNSVSVTEKIDGVTLRTYTATLGATNTFSITGNTWLTMLNGSHTLTVTASDGQASTTRTWTFTKSVTTVQFVLSSPLAADAMPTKCICNIQGSFPLGSTLTFEVCNNGNDASPTWENITTKVLNGQKHFFTNTTKTAVNWGFNIRVTLLRGTATGTCAIQSVGGNFE